MRSLSALVSTLTVVPRRRLTTSSIFAISALAVAESGGLPKTGDGKGGKGFVQFCEEEVMAQKAHGTSDAPVQQKLRWDADRDTADRICNFNRHYAEHAGYWKTTKFMAEVERDKPTVYYDSVTGLPLFVAPIGRTMSEFLSETPRLTQCPHAPLHLCTLLTVACACVWENVWRR